MKKEEFDKIKGDGIQSEHVFLSKERFHFKCKRVEFYYRYKIYAWTHGLANNLRTDYLLFVDVDEESIHKTHKEKVNPTIDSTFYDRYFGFLLKKRTTNGHFNDKDAEWLMERVEKIRLEPKIKENRYQKIFGIVNGEEYSI